jgi:hypothetical protein
MDEDMRKHGHPEFYKLLDNIADLHSRKNRDYATQDDPLQNFKRVAEICKRYKLITPGHEALKVAIIYMLKQQDAAFKLLMHEQEGLVEGIPERLKDVAVYSLIENILYKEGE